MFGIGSYLKKIRPRYREAKLFRDAAKLKAAGYPVLSALETDVYVANYSFNIMPDQKLVYVEIAKAGCTTMKAILSRSVYGVELANKSRYHKRRLSKLKRLSDFKVSTLQALFSDPDTLVFTVVRDPYARLLSCYKNVIARLPLFEESNGKRKEVFEKYDGEFLADEIAKNRMSFETFVDFACATARARVNGHWNMMSDGIPEDGLLPVKVLKLENLSTDILPVLDRLGASDEVRQMASTKMNPSRPVDGAVWTPELMDKVRVAYAADFERFGYPTEQRLWDVAKAG